jgi:predicted dehydrogenase
MLKLAFAGFRHGHIMGFYNACKTHPQVKLVAACEEDGATIESLRSAGKVNSTHTNLREMLDSVDCDAVAVGDFFAKRGSVIIESLNAGKHVIADKPVCTKLEELEQIASLTQPKKLRLGCLLDLRDSGVFVTVRRMIQSGEIGEVLTICVTAQHPLLLSSRPKWYFEPGKQGGTINDIGIHAVDLIRWLTAQPIAQALSAREWNARLPQFPHFHDGAQMMLTLANGAGIFADMSYFTPDGLAYAAPQYWRLTIHGTAGLIEASFSQRTLSFATSADKSPQPIEPDADIADGRLEAFMRDIAGQSQPADLTTADVLDASRRTLKIQQAAGRNQHNVSLNA